MVVGAARPGRSPVLPHRPPMAAERRTSVVVEVGKTWTFAAALDLAWLVPAG